MTTTTLDLLDRLIGFATVSRDPNRDLIEFVRAHLAARGIESELFFAEDGRKANLFATVGPRDVPGVMLSGHTDVVPVDGQNWSKDPFRMSVSGGRAYGRGTADMKGFIASALALLDRLDPSRLNWPIHFALSHDEELGCVGVHSLLDALAGRATKPRLAIVGEPTLMRIATGHKGKIGARAICCGVESHSAMAPKALNAIHLACEFIGQIRLRQDEIARNGPRDDDFEVPYTTLHVGKINGGTALNIVPNRCVVDFEIRNIAQDNAETILDRLMDDAAAIARDRQQQFPQADIRIDVFNTYPGLATPPDAEVVRFVGALIEDPVLFKVPFGTEGGLFSDRLGVPTVVCGPGSMDQGHKPDEFIALVELDACDRMMDRLAAQISG